jgi:hypothetical protein
MKRLSARPYDTRDARTTNLSQPAIGRFGLDLVALLAQLLVVTIVLQGRHGVAARIRAPRQVQVSFAALRNLFAGI